MRDLRVWHKMNRYRQLAPSDPRPVFVHGMWRTGSTYIWNKFRLQKEYRAFLEPFHEELANRSKDDLRESLPPTVTGMMRHPTIDHFYFDEYDFKEAKGVPFFEKYFSYERYSLQPDSDDEFLRRYIASLLDIAGRHGQRPVLQFNRGLLRAGWIRANFGGITVLIVRNPLHVWRSFLSFPTLYFPTVTCMIVGQNIGDPLLSRIATRHDIPFFVRDRFADEYALYYNFVASKNIADLYPVFYDLCTAGNLHVARHADVIIDMDEISANSRVRALLLSQLESLGVRLSLDDCSTPQYPAETACDRIWVSYEQIGRAELRASQMSRLSIPSSRVEFFSQVLSPYFRCLLEEFQV